METIRDLRETKQLSQDKVAAATGLSYAKFVRIEEGSGKTTQEEIDRVLTILKGMEPGTRKLAGRPFKDPAKQAAVRAAREQGQSVAAALGFVSTEAASGQESPAEEETPKQRKARLARERRAANKNGSNAAALAKKAPSRTKKAKKDEQPDEEESVEDLIGEPEPAGLVEDEDGAPLPAEQQPETDVVETGDGGTPKDGVEQADLEDTEQRPETDIVNTGDGGAIEVNEEPAPVDTVMINGVEVEV